MKFYKTSANKYTLESNHQYKHIFGLVFIIGAILGLLHFSLSSYYITCADKNPEIASNCTLTTKVFGIFSNDTKLGVIHKAFVKKNTGRYSIFSTNIETDRGTIEVTDSSSQLYMQANAKQINNYIKNSFENTVDIPYSVIWFDYLSVLLVGLLGFYFMFFNKDMHIAFDNKNKLLAVIESGIIEKLTKCKNYSYKDIDKISLEKSSAPLMPDYQLNLILKDGSIINLDTVYTFDKSQIQENIEDANVMLAK